MPEGISENLPPKKPGIVRKIASAVKESLPWDPIGKKKRSIKPVSNEQMKEDNKSSKLLDLESNIKASKQFIESLRNPNLYNQAPHDSLFLKSSLGYMVKESVEFGWFDVASVVNTAKDRYQLPLAIYVDRNHARLVVKGAYQTPEGRKIKVYDPMSNGFEEILINEAGIPVGVTANSLIGSRMMNGEYDITKFFDDPELIKYRALLMSVKAFSFQRDPRNCIPYCLFVGAMLNGLEPGNTVFKTNGIRQFEQDFGVRIIIREEMLPQKPRIKIIE